MQLLIAPAFTKLLVRLIFNFFNKRQKHIFVISFIVVYSAIIFCKCQSFVTTTGYFDMARWSTGARGTVTL